MDVQEENGLVDTKRAARRCHVSTSMLEKLRVYGGGPRYLKLGPRTVRYRLADLDAWLESKAAASTSAVA